MLAALTSVGAMAGVLLAAGSEEVKRFFSYGKKPSTGVIEVVLLPTMVGETVTFTVYGEGKSGVVVRSSGQEKRVLWKREVWLGEDEVEKLVDAAVTGNLLRFNPADQERRRKDPPRTDSGGVAFKISLEHYAEGAQPAEGPVEHKILVGNPAELARQNPDTVEYQAMKRLVARLNQLYRDELAKEGGR